jgi:hypothetical protein
VARSIFWPDGVFLITQKGKNLNTFIAGSKFFANRATMILYISSYLRIGQGEIPGVRNPKSPSQLARGPGIGSMITLGRDKIGGRIPDSIPIA